VEVGEEAGEEVEKRTEAQRLEKEEHHFSWEQQLAVAHW
jgi:hypothetical protein